MKRSQRGRSVRLGINSPIMTTEAPAVSQRGGGGGLITGYLHQLFPCLTRQKVNHSTWLLGVTCSPSSSSSGNKLLLEDWFQYPVTSTPVSSVRVNNTHNQQSPSSHASPRGCADSFTSFWQRRTIMKEDRRFITTVAVRSQ